jgi:hypothetical protein
LGLHRRKRHAVLGEVNDGRCLYKGKEIKTKGYIKFILIFIVILFIALECNSCKKNVQKPSTPENEKVSVGWVNSYNFVQFPNETNRNLFSLEKTSVVETGDGGYVVAGNVRKVEGSNKVDIFLLKVDSNGSGVWAKTFSDNSYDSSPVIKNVKDGYILIFETSDFPQGNEKCIAIKFDKDFNVVWERLIKAYKNINFGVFNFNIIQTDDEGYALLLDNGSDSYPFAVLVKINKTGGIEWEKDFKEHITSMDSDEGNIVLLSETNLTNLSFSVLRLDNKGNELWAKPYALKDYNKAIAIKKSSDGGYFVLGLGTYEPSKDGSGIVIVNGKEMFKFPDDSGLYRITSFNNGLCVITAEHMAIDPIESLLQLHPDKFPLYGFFVLKIDKDGTKVWTKIFVERFILPSYLNYFNPILSLDDGGCVVSFAIYSLISMAGVPSSRMALVLRLDKNGNTKWSENFEAGDLYASLASTTNGFIASGTYTLFTFDRDGNVGNNCNYLFKFDIGNKELDTVAKPDEKAISPSAAFTVSSVELEVNALDLPEVSTICGE